jgi:hypothetical protein
MESHPQALVGRWVRSWEEDAGDVRAYRRDTFAFPLSRRPRSVLELEPDGRAVSRTGGPADTLVGREGRWDVDDAGRLTVQWDAPEDAGLAAGPDAGVDADDGAAGAGAAPVAAEIVERSADLLRLRPLEGRID